MAAPYTQLIPGSYPGQRYSFSPKTENLILNPGNIRFSDEGMTKPDFTEEDITQPGLFSEGLTKLDHTGERIF